ncbi:MAG TPA: MgtC/SapB family protein [Vicinamibacteria bacterium]|nr:MgtC/SapB family protein [Vicinamibacteria bacterium]
MQELLPGLVRGLRLELLFQLAVAVLLGGAIGLERELSGKPAGLRTNVLICTGAAFFTVLSLHIAADRGDPARVAAQILPGIGFIGAGTILHMRGAVTGLTSAATIWVVAAIGMALGSNAYLEAIGATALVLLVLGGLRKVERLVALKATRSHLLVHARAEATTVEELESVVRATGLEIDRTSSRRENVDMVVEFDLRGPRRLHDQALVAVVHHPDVRSVSTGE